MTWKFTYNSWRRDLGNFSLLKYRTYQGFLVTAQNSGTHWLKYMLSLAIADRYGLPPPAWTNNPDSNDYIGHPKHQRKYPQTPALASSHGIPHPLLKLAITHRLLDFPCYGILVRDMRAALVSHFEKHKKRYNCGFSEFLAGDPSGALHRADIWWHIRFCNGWGSVLELLPGRSLLLSYENLVNDPVSGLAGINNLFELGLSETHIVHAVKNAGKEHMAARVRHKDDEDLYRFIRFDDRNPLDWYSKEDRKLFGEITGKFLRFNPGYDYDDWKSIRPLAG